VRASIIILVTPIALLFLATTNAYATQFSFNTSTGEPSGQFDFSLPAAMIALASVVGAILIIYERRKARGIWFSNSERLK
jgi:uncharacterized integral membrane protein